MNNDAVSRRRVVITGVGLITPLGHNVPDTWAAILAGRSGFGPLTLVDNPNHTIGGLCEVKNFDPAEYMDRKDARRRDRYQQLAVVAAAEAMRQANLSITDDNRERIGITIGTGVGGMRTIVDQEDVLREGGLRRLNPFGITMIMPNGAAGMLAIEYGITGPSTTITTACAAGNDAVGHAFRSVRYGEVDAILTGGTECIMTSIAIGGFERAGATSTRSSNAPQPFDANRDGLVIGEGAGMLVLESLEHAQARGANILAEIVGYGQTTDAFHITAPPDDGSGAARAIRKALVDSGLRPEEVDYVSAHGTATPLNDAAETKAIKAALGEHAYNVAISSTKSMTGHIMGATGAIESVFCTLAIRDQILPPTINYSTPDPACDLDYVPNTARPARVRVCLNNAFGFGGHNAVLVIKEFE
ncbi:MAG: beta-ketoacyl-ACP synthase II [Anaerolineae bacterium]|nr:beta-ketoacyl-ACP synthase II [Anaerolineae bacterium]RIK23717.1 MAG: beta-ketoacyl-[acyl-carrier-protein] synthase II [Anaerolineae bacterium]